MKCGPLHVACELPLRGYLGEVFVVNQGRLALGEGYGFQVGCSKSGTELGVVQRIWLCARRDGHRGKRVRVVREMKSPD